jgi:hypothetical protein
VAAPTIEIARAIISDLGTHVNLEGNDILTKFNGVEVDQTRDYIRLHCATYLDRVLDKHGWNTPQYHDPSLKEPLHDKLVKQIDLDVGPPEHSAEAKAIEVKAGFKFRQVLGELMYAYVICRLDIGYILTKLSQYSLHPAAIHYTCLRNIALYLRNTRDWGITYWRPQPLDCFLSGSLRPMNVVDQSLPVFPSTDDPLQLVGYVDAAHATDTSTRRSVTGFILTVCGAAVCFRSKVQTTIATSSTEAEFIAAVSASKAVKYLRSILNELGCPQHYPTPMYEDNEAAIAMINANKPTERSRHIDIQHFAIQQWKTRGEIIFHHIPGSINIADAMTKALGWILQHRHVRRAMGHYLPSFLSIKRPT